jgi:type II secretory pathway pseudopilin PulG
MKPGWAGRRGGFTLVELVLGMSILVISTLALGLSLQAGAMATRGMREEQVLLAQAETFVDRIVAQGFGHEYDPDPTASQVEEAFDGDADPGDVTLWQLARSPSADDGWKFRLTDFSVAGEWRIRLDQDLNGDGVVSGTLESSKDVFRVRVFFDDRLILETNRAKEVTL